jgi:hypothetical protein
MTTTWLLGSSSLCLGFTFETFCKYMRTDLVLSNCFQFFHSFFFFWDWIFNVHKWICILYLCKALFVWIYLGLIISDIDLKTHINCKIILRKIFVLFRTISMWARFWLLAGFYLELVVFNILLFWHSWKILGLLHSILWQRLILLSSLSALCCYMILIKL